jgi:DNA-binding transcriptional LysR family regulator
MFKWDDVKYFLAVARSGSTIAAAKLLKQNQSTVQRRLAELEQHLGQTLFDKPHSGYRISSFGQGLLPFAEQLERAAIAFDNRRHVKDRVEHGVVRLTCPEPVMIRLVKAGIPDMFGAKHPGLKIEFVMRDSYVDLKKGEADVAFRSGDTEDNELVGRKIADSIWSVYASKSYLQKHGQPQSFEELDRHTVIAFEGAMTSNRAASWLAAVAPNAPVAVRVSSVLGLVSAAKSGVAVVPMPVALGNAEDDLVRIFESVPELTRSWRILAHPDVRATSSVSAFFDFVNDEIAAFKPILTG